MNSENLNGILIFWNKPLSERDYNNLQDGDFTVLNYNKPCPVTDGSPITFTGVENAENYEWLVKSQGAIVEGIDYDLFSQNTVDRPTNTKHAEFVNYNIWLTEIQNVRRTNEELIQVIRDKENEANNSVLNESERNKLQMIAPAVNAKLASGLSLNTQEQAVYNRMLEVSQKAMLNASNAANLISIVNTNGTPDIKSGWEYDNISSQGFPFA